ncbi:hypothetical protein B0H14DRAFT_2994689 [Mycena olivaceomarginata]|nr:hypothetical protein B0H14DRAFT_2994689 [Mycena olivaceomarginata]
MVRLNERLRILRYPKGGFFRGHCDGIYMDQETKQRTFYTLQFYLPSDASGASFLGTKYADVEAVPGRVLVFQHADLFHTGEEVIDGFRPLTASSVLCARIFCTNELARRYSRRSTSSEIMPEQWMDFRLVE